LFAENAIRQGKPSDKRLTKNQARAMRKLFLSHTVQHVYTDAEIKAMVKKSIGLDKSKVTEFRYVSHCVCAIVLSVCMQVSAVRDANTLVCMWNWELIPAQWQSVVVSFFTARDTQHLVTTLRGKSCSGWFL
jgi:hypothetical protein